ncbi:hypothetical protein [Poriferisphaera sp. WC338]|uniref:hypothetical protein n=1 Tax=Poriferisphaera sp. WC338 TaxID=3425129 RepID=UPI003D817E14
MRKQLKNLCLSLMISTIGLAGSLSAQPMDGGPHGPEDRSGQPRERRDAKPSGDRRSSRDHLMRPELKDREVREAIVILGAFDPDLAKELAKKFEEQPREVAQMLHRRFPRLGVFLRLKKFDPESFELRIEDIRLISEARRLAAEYREAMAVNDQVLAEQLNDELGLVLELHFDVRTKLHQLQIDRMQARLNTLRSELTRRIAEKNVLIQSQLESVAESGLEVEREPMWMLERRAPREKEEGPSPSGAPIPPDARPKPGE